MSTRRRTWARAAATAALTLAIVLLPASAAPAATAGFPGMPDCKSPPQVTTPTEGALGDLDVGPGAPKDGDPFRKGATVTVYEVYGWGGLTWPDYDLGCGPDAARDPGAVGTGTAADFLLRTLTALDQATTQANRWAMNPRTLAVIDPFNIAAASGFGLRVFVPLIGLSLGLVGITILLRARRGDVGAATRRGGWSLGVGVLGVVATFWPLLVAPTIDSTLQQSVAMVSTSLARAATPAPSLPDALAGNLQRSGAYETWRRGVFGSNTVAADKYGPALFTAGTFSRADVRRMRADPKARENLAKRKQAAYKDTAAKIQDEYPDSYQYLAGKRNGDRVIAALAGLVGWFTSSSFTALMSVLLLFTGSVLRVLLAVLPLICLLALHPRFQHILIGPLNYLLGLMLASVTFGAASALLIAAHGGLMAAGTNVWLVIVLMSGMSLAAAVLLWPVLQLVAPQRLKEAVGAARAARRATPAAAQGDPDLTPRQQTPVGPYADPAPHARRTFADATPAEAQTKLTAVRGAVHGATRGAATSLAAGAVTGGTLTVAAAGVAAARKAGAGALAGARHAYTGPPARRLRTPGLTASTPSTAGSTGSIGGPAATPTPAEADLGGSPVSVRTGGSPARTYRPAHVAGPTEPAPTRRRAGSVVHQISDLYQPGSPS